MTYLLPSDPEDAANRERIVSLATLYEAGDTSVGSELMKLIGRRVPRLREEFSRITGEPLCLECISDGADRTPAPIKAFWTMKTFESIINGVINPPKKEDLVSLEELRRRIQEGE